MAYDARVVSGEGADLAVDPNVSQGAAPRSTMTKRREPIEMTEHGSVWAMSDPLGGIGGEGGMVGGSGGTIPLAQALSGIAGVGGGGGARPALRPSPAGLSIGIEPGGGDDGGGGMGGGPGISTGDVGTISPSAGQIGTTIGGLSLGASVLGGLSAGVGARGGPGIGVGISPTGGAGLSARTGSPALDFALGLGRAFSGIPTGVNLLSMVAPGLAPIGMMGMGPGMAIGLGKTVGQAMNMFGIPTQESTLAAVQAGLRSTDPSAMTFSHSVVSEANAGLAALGRGESVHITDDNVANMMGNAGVTGHRGSNSKGELGTFFSAGVAAGIPDSGPHSMVSGVTMTSLSAQLSNLGLANTTNNMTAIASLSPSQLNIALNQSKETAIAAIAAKAHLPLNFNRVDTGEPTAADPNVTDITDAPPQGGLTGNEPGGNVPGSPTAGVGTAAPAAPAADTPDVTDTGITAGDEGGGAGGAAGGDCIIASWAMNGVKAPDLDQRREFFQAFYKYWLKKYPLSGKRQVRKYQLIARRLIEQIARKGPAEVAGAQQEIYQIVIVPTGATLEPSEFDGAYQRLRSTLTALVGRYGLQLDPADIPNPSDEAKARIRENRRKRTETVVEDEAA